MPKEDSKGSSNYDIWIIRSITTNNRWQGGFQASLPTIFLEHRRDSTAIGVQSQVSLRIKRDMHTDMNESIGMRVNLL